ncbi:MAG: hypothetical protein NZM35_06330 [Chitinophagales bacterium]|nr:hypothetical protein [Chitinophagales bacterium]MDW8418843.1 phosphopantothenoylcysteine decarboxylase [Chitinophagales bacterium]
MLRVLITAGPTRERIDPVRYISNYSTGKMGIALAEEFAGRGCSVTLVKGPTHLSVRHRDVHVVEVECAREMLEAVQEHFAGSNVAIFAAAVADYAPASEAASKLKKHDDRFTLELVKTADIAATMGRQRMPGQYLVGFALETDDEAANARQKLIKKNLDAIVLNSLRDPGAGFQYDTNRITIIEKNGAEYAYPLKSKAEVAKDIADFIMQRCG